MSTLPKRVGELPGWSTTESGGRVDTEGRNPVFLLLGVFALIGAATATVIALGISPGFCEESNCESGFFTQPVLALAGLVPAVAVLIAAWHRNNLLALACFLLTALFYALWLVAVGDPTH
jgi:hypothetical protein